MPPDDASAPSPPKLFGPIRTKLWIAAACALILLAGALTIPAPAPSSVPPSQERPVPLLEAEVQRREQLRLFSELQALGPRLMSHSVTVGPPEGDRMLSSDLAPMTTRYAEPAGHGLIISADGEILTTADAVQGRESLQVILASGRVAEAQVIAYDPETDLVLLHAPSVPRADAAPWSQQPPAAGVLAIAVAHINRQAAVAPVFVTGPPSPDGRIRTTTAELRSGTPIYTVDGEVFALASGGHAPDALLVGPAIARIRDLIAGGRARRGAIGLTFQPVSGALGELYSSAGVLVSDVAADGPAEDAGILAGDFITSVGGTAVTSVEDARRAIAALRPGAPVTIGLTRARKPVTLEVQPTSALSLRARQMPPVTASPAAPEARTVLDAPTRAANGLEARSRIVAVDGRRVTSAAEARTQIGRARGPVLLYVADDRGRFFIVLERPE